MLAGELLAISGPYRISGNVTVPAGSTLKIAAGTTLFFDTGASLTVAGRLLAEGTESKPIRFTKTPGGGNWAGIQFQGTMQDNRISQAIIEYGVTDNGLIGLVNSNLTLDHVFFDHTDRRRIRSTDSSLVVRNSTFTDVFPGTTAPSSVGFSEHIYGEGIPAGGQVIIENNVFGTTKGRNNAIDFDAASQPGAVVQILDNVFHGGGEDAIELTADAHVEGNVFTHFHKDAYNIGVGYVSTISLGAGHQLVAARNVFYDLDHAVLVKEDAQMTFLHNTVAEVDMAAIYFDLPGEAASPGRGAYLDADIFTATPVVFGQVIASTELAVDDSILPAEYQYLGTGNFYEDPRLANPSGDDFSLRPGSPAFGAGPNGLDIGATAPGGAWISNQPPVLTGRTDAALVIGGPDITHYRYQLDGGSWLPETPVATPISLAGLADGPHTVLVIGKNSAGVWQDVAQAASTTWTIDSTLARVRINEVLASIRRRSSMETPGPI